MSGLPQETQEILRERFAIQSLRPPQERAIAAVLAGRDVLLTMPTGAGKSLVYQLPALLLEGLVLVVSPLIALMKDQVDALRGRGVRASCVDSTLSAREREQRLERAAAGELDLLFVTPERFRSPGFRALLPRLRIVRLAVDEAHCISQWGHDFRPDYSRLGQYRALVGSPPAIALTATATPRVAEDIVAQLDLRDPLVIRTGIEREGLFFAVSPIERAEDKVQLLADRVRSIDGPGIVYSTLIRDLEHLRDELARRDVEGLVYHGRLSSEERHAMQEHFMQSERAVVLATNAFGMGVDKADIRFVLHAQIPRTLEAWVQEVGRAGRDGDPAWCELLYFEEDLAIHQNFIQWANPSREYLLGVYETLRAWGERIQTRDLDDLRAELLIKNRSDNRVGICLKWLEVLGVTQGSFEQHDLEVVRELEAGELPPSVGSEDKHRADLEGLLSMAQFAKSADSCRRAGIARHFGLASTEGPCGACDACTPADTWRSTHLSARPAHACKSELPPDDRDRSPYRRGDWVRVDGRHLGQVLRVEGSGRNQRLVVEDARDLRRRQVDPRRRRVERLEGGSGAD